MKAKLTKLVDTLKGRIIFICTGVIFATALFTSCPNFMDNSAKKDIEEAIYIANHECPVATVQEPAYSDEGVSKNKAIIISFSLPIDTSTFANNFTIQDDAGNNLTQYFLAPVWSNDNKLVTIAADELNLIDLGGNTTKDIFITLSKKCTTADKLPLKDAINHKYRICNKVDNDPPTVALVKGELPPAYINREAEEGEEPAVLVAGVITSETEKAICDANHINTKVDFYIEGNDYGGGEIWAKFVYRRVYDAVGNAVNDQEKTYLIKLEDKAENDNYCGKYCLDLSDQEYLDGLYEVKIYARDTYGLESKEPVVYNVIRDTILAYSFNGRINLVSRQWRNIEEIPQNFDFKIQNLDWEDANRKLPDIVFNGKTFSGEVYNGPDSIDYYKENSIGATEQLTAQFIENLRKWIIIYGINDDVYYVSSLTGKTYSNTEDEGAFSFYLVWGTDTDKLTEPVKLEWNESGDVERLGNYMLPEACLTYCEEHQDDDIYFVTTYVDAVGNKNTMSLVYPKRVNFFNYVVEDDDVNGNQKKKVTLNFSDMSNQRMENFLNLPYKTIRVLYRIFYGELEEGQSSENTSLVQLTRNASEPWLYDPYGSVTDSRVIYNLEPNKKYVVYIQSDYETDSLTNNQYAGGIQGAMRKVIINTGFTGGTALSKPEFTWTKESAGINTGLFNVKVNVTNFDSNKNNNVKYVPVYSIDGTNWVYYESYSDNGFTFAVENPLKMPIGRGELWNNSVWDYTVRTANWGSWEDDNTYFIAVDHCKTNFGYPSVKAKVKIVAVNDNEYKESDVQEIEFFEDDDNIPPYVSSDIITHDSKLSYDGHSFDFNGLVWEDEGHVSEYFDFYYVPYQEMWGNNLYVLSEDEIASLPGGVCSFDTSCWIDGTTGDSAYHLNIAIPTFGLEDGKYLYFAKLTDTYGNYKYVTLGQAHIGTFKNKLTVEYDEQKNHFISTLPIEADETFERYMINVQQLGYEQRKDAYTWNDWYGFGNQLQNCAVISKDGKTVVFNETEGPECGTFVEWSTAADKYVTVAPKELDDYGYYKITIQAFNENPYDKTTGKGVDFSYGRPYSDYDESGSFFWEKDISGWVENESEYDLCTDETVSNTVYLYVPPKRSLDPGWYENPVQSYFFSDTAAPRSNRDYIVNVIASCRDLGDDIDEWERRGKIIKSRYYYTNIEDPEYGQPGHNEQWIPNPEFNTFDETVALNDMYESHEKGFVYYVAVVHFADNSTAISKVYTMQRF